MASAYIPEMRKTGLGATFVTGRGMYLPAPALAVFVPADQAIRTDEVRDAAGRQGAQVIAVKAVESKKARGQLLLFEPKAGFDTRAFWRQLGVAREHLQTISATDLGFGKQRISFGRQLGIHKAFFSPRQIGLSRYGCMVHDTPLGRVAVRKNGEIYREWEPGKDGERQGAVRDFFLRAANVQDLDGVARGIVLAMRESDRFTRDTFRKVYEAAVAPDLQDKLTPSMLAEHVESAAVAAVLRSVAAGWSPGHIAGLLDSRLPYRDNAARSLTTSQLDQFSTPLPVAAVAAEILAPLEGETVLEPMVGNGTLASATAALGAVVTGIELDTERAARAEAVLGADHSIVQGRFEDWAAAEGRDQRFDILLANPPFSTEFKAQVVADPHGRRVRIARADHHYIWEALKHLKPDGRAFVVMAGDVVDQGKLGGTRREFDSILRSNFEIAGAAVLHGKLYRKMGTNFPTQLYAIGPRRAVPLSLEESVAATPDEIPVLRTQDELRAWGQQVRDNMAALLSARNPDRLRPPSLRTDVRTQPVADGASPVNPWDAPVQVASFMAAHDAFLARKVVGLADGSLVRAEPSASGWTVVQRDADGVFHRKGAEGEARGWNRDEALAHAVSLWVTAAALAERGSARPTPAAQVPRAPSAAAEAAERAEDASPTQASPPHAEERRSRTRSGVPGPEPDRLSPSARAGSRAGARSPSAPAVPGDGAQQDIAPQGVGEVAAEAAEAVPRPPVTPRIMEGILASLPRTVENAEQEEDDPFLLPYEPMSNLGEPSTRIQRALSSPTMAALADVDRIYGGIDQMVASRLGMTEEEMAKRLSSEQIDGLALSFWAQDRGKGCINGDSMGVGKGRFLAAHIMKALRENRAILFFTERPDLFQDMLGRDLPDVLGVPLDVIPQLVTPFILNNVPQARVVDFDRAGRGGDPLVLFKHDGAAMAAARLKTAISPEFNIVVGTYSQFSHSAGGWKQAAILAWMRHQHETTGAAPVVLIDEAHRAAGEMSRASGLVAAVVEAATQMGSPPIYSSATALKSVKNIAVYSPALPDVGMSREQLQLLVESNPLALQEALAYEMARQGTMFSREMDQAGVVREFVPLVDLNPEKYARLRAKMDVIADFLAEMMTRSGEVADTADLISKRLRADAERQGSGMAEDRAKEMISTVQVNTTSPASRFHTLSQYMMLAFKANFATELVLKSIAEGRKPLLVVDNVGDSMVEWKLGLEAEEDADAPEDVDELTRKSLPRLPSLADVLSKMADAMLTVTVRDGWGVMSKHRVTSLEPWLAGFQARLEEADLDELTTSALDKIRMELAEYEITVGELTRRRYELSATDDGGYRVGVRRRLPAQEIVRAFNGGDLEVAILNRSASSGISAHASPRNGLDLRQREMIKLQLQGDITHERQLDGRIHRTGQVQPGRYTLPMSGFAADDRLNAMFNRKNRSLSSASHASRENRTNIDQAPDILNSIGDVVVFNYLRDNPVLAARFGLEIGDLPSEGLARRLLGRMIVLPADLQSAVTAEVESQFRLQIADLEAKGENPLRLNRYEWGASVREIRQLVAGDKNAGSAAKKPLTLNELTFTEKVTPLRFARVESDIAEVRNKWSENGRFVGLDERFEELDRLRETGVIDWNGEVFDRVLNRSEGLASLGLGEISVQDAAEVYAQRDALKNPNNLQKGILTAARTAAFLAANLPFLEPGRILGLNPEVLTNLRTSHFCDTWNEGNEADADVIPAIVRNVRFNRTRPLNLGEWEVDLAVPGESRIATLSLASVISQEEAAAIVHEQRMAEDPDYIPPALALSAFIDASDTFSRLTNGLGPDHTAELASIDGNEKLGAPEKWNAMLRTFFDRIGPGEVIRKRRTIEGNVFEAVALATRKKLGEKIIYTDESGELRHAILLKQDKKLGQRLESALAARSAVAPADATLLFGLTRVLKKLNALCREQNVLKEKIAAQQDYEKRNGHQLDWMRVGIAEAQRRVERHAREVASALAPTIAAAAAAAAAGSATAAPNKEAEVALVAAVMSKVGTPDFERWVQAITSDIERARSAPAVMAIGPLVVPDGFRGPAPVTCEGEGKGFALPSGMNRSGLPEMGKLLSVNRDAGMVILTDSLVLAAGHAKGSFVANTKVPWGTVNTKGFKFPAAMTVAGIERDDMDALVASAQIHRLDITLYGPIRALYEQVNTISAEMAAEMTLAAEAKQQVDYEASSTPALAG